MTFQYLKKKKRSSSSITKMTRWILKSEEEERNKEKRRSWQQHSKWRVWPIELFVCVVYIAYTAVVIDNMQRRRWRINVDFPNCACWSCSASSLVPLCRVIVQQVKAYTVVCRPTEIKEKRLGLAGWWTNKIFSGCVGLQTASTDGLIPPFVCCCGFTRVWRSPLIYVVWWTQKRPNKPLDVVGFWLLG
jgi:hypothetical protein